MDSACDLDRLSTLPDDVLHVILAFVGEAAAVSLTAVLSRRWRRVWVHAQGLSFSDANLNVRDDEPRHFADFVDWALAQRGDVDIGSLEISAERHGGAASPEQVNGWLRHAARHAVASFRLHLLHGTTARGAIELPSHGRTASIHLDLESQNMFNLPAAPARYEALTELTLRSVWLGEEGRGRCRALGDFVSTSCPRLRVLDVDRPRWLRRLVLRTATLEELRLSDADDLRTLDVTAPSLRVLRLHRCFHSSPTYRSGEQVIHKAARVAAPRLEEVSMHGVCCSPAHLVINGLSSVRRLSDLHLYVHGQHWRDPRGSVRLLETCPGTEHVGISLDHCEPPSVAMFDEFVDMAAEGAVPFANVRSMVVDARFFPEHHFASSMWPLLWRFPCVRSLCIRFSKTKRVKWGQNCALCGSLQSGNRPKISLGSLEEVELNGLAGALEEMDLVIFLFESSKSINTMTVKVARASKELAAELMKIPSTDRGCWRFKENVYTWTCI